jgi:spermidine synthase
MMGWTPRDGIERVWPAKRRLPPARLAREWMRPARLCFESDCAAAIFAAQVPKRFAMEACASSHYWARELSRLGHELQVIPPSYVKPFGKRQKIRTRFVCQKQLAWPMGGNPDKSRALGDASATQVLFLYLLFFLSGFSALVYQTAWQRMLGLFGGSDSISSTIVVGAFLLGLGLGSLVASTFADRLSDRGVVFAFALCEMGIAAFALASKLLFYDFLFGKMTALVDSHALLFLVAFLSLLIPTLLMGLSLPLLAKGVVRTIETASERIGYLYGVNTLGAAAGAFVAGCLLIGTFGYESTVQLAAVLNLLVGGGALLLASSFRTGDWRYGFRPAAVFQATAVRARVWQWCLLVFVSGFIIISLEIIWFRVIGVLLQSTAYSFAVLLGWVLLGDAVGIIVGALAVRRISRPWHFFLWLQGAVTLYAIAALWMVALANQWPAIFNLFIGFSIVEPFRLTIGHITMIFGTIAFAVVPPAILLGMSFPITQKAIQDDPAVVGQRVGLIQAANILGNTAGSIVTGLILLQHLGTSGSLRLLALFGLLFIGALLVDGFRTGIGSRWQFGYAAFAAGLMIAVVGFPNGTGLWSLLHAVDSEHVILGEDRTGVALMVHNSADGGALYIGGHHQSGVPFSQVHGVLGLLGVMVHPSPRSVLVVGHGTGGTSYAAGANPSIDRVRVVEIVAPIYNVMSEFSALGGKTAVDQLLADPRYERVVGDARHVLFTDPERYDVIEADPIRPSMSLSGLLFSVEYFRQVRARLRPGGICVQWIPSPRSLNSLVSVFPYVVDLFDGYILLGSDQPIRFDANAVARRLQEPAIRTYLEAAKLDTRAIGDWLLSGHVKLLRPGDPRPDEVNTDLFPKDEFFLNTPWFSTRFH